MPCTEMAFFPTNFMLHTLNTNHDHDQDHHHHHHNHPHHHHHHQSPASLPPVLPPDFHSVASFLGKKSPFTGIEMCEEGNNGNIMNNHLHNLNNNNNNVDQLDDYNSDDGSQGGGEKKRRLNMEQVRTLEKNFEVANKLEPERKIQLARALNLQPRQIAIWFQNRRARWKTKQLEKDYDVLKRQFDAIKAENDALIAHNQKLQAEIIALKNREPTESINLNINENEESSSNRSENSSEIRLEISRTLQTESPNSPSANLPAATTSRQFFTSSSRATTSNAPNVAQLLNNTPSRSDQVSGNAVKEENYSNMFSGIDDQTAFWPWLEQHNFN